MRFLSVHFRRNDQKWKRIVARSRNTSDKFSLTFKEMGKLQRTAGNSRGGGYDRNRAEIQE